MSDEIKPIRRVVTGNDANGRSGVLFDSAAPNVKTSPFQQGTNMTDIWVFHTSPAVIWGARDDGNLPFQFEPPRAGGHLRVVQSVGKPSDYDAATDTSVTPMHPPRMTEGGTWERGGQNRYTTRMHKSETLDYGILLPASACCAPMTGSACSSPATSWCRSEAGTPGPIRTKAARWPSS